MSTRKRSNLEEYTGLEMLMVESSIFCPKCGAAMAPNASFCTTCGYNVASSATFTAQETFPISSIDSLQESRQPERDPFEPSTPEPIQQAYESNYQSQHQAGAYQVTAVSQDIYEASRISPSVRQGVAQEFPTQAVSPIRQQVHRTSDQTQQPYGFSPEYGAAVHVGIGYYYVTIVFLFLSALYAISGAVGSFMASMQGWKPAIEAARSYSMYGHGSSGSGSQGNFYSDLAGYMSSCDMFSIIAGIVFILAGIVSLVAAVTLLMRKKSAPTVASWVWPIVALFFIAGCIFLIVIPVFKLDSLLLPYGASIFNSAAMLSSSSYTAPSTIANYHAFMLAFNAIVAILIAMAVLAAIFTIVNRIYFKKRRFFFDK